MTPELPSLPPFTADEIMNLALVMVFVVCLVSFHLFLMSLNSLHSCVTLVSSICDAVSSAYFIRVLKKMLNEINPKVNLQKTASKGRIFFSLERDPILRPQDPQNGVFSDL